MTTPDTGLSAARDDLLRAADRLESLLSDPADTADLALLRSVALRLSQGRSATQALRSYDAARLPRLLDLAGPANAAELLAQLTQDLGNARQTVERAAQARDWSDLRRSSHVLISLTGSVGGLSLQDMSERLNATAQREDAPTLATLIPPLLAELDALLAIIATTPPAQENAR